MGWRGGGGWSGDWTGLEWRETLSSKPSLFSRCDMFLYLFLFFFIKAFSMLANHVLSNMKIRKGEQRRDALLARLNVDTDQLLGERKKLKLLLYNQGDRPFPTGLMPLCEKGQANCAVRCMFQIR